MSLRRHTIPLFIAFLAILLAMLGQNLWRNLEALSGAGNENAQWTILQLDTEFANLHAVLLEEAARPEPNRDEIRLRTDIALSRINLVGVGVAGEIVRTDEASRALLQRITDYADQAAPLVDGNLDADDIARLTELTAATAPLARNLALKGIQIGAERTEARRNEFARKLRNTGFVAIGVMGALAAVLVILNRSLLIAHEKDRDLRASSKRFESTISGSLDAIVTSNEDGEILDFNPAAEKVFGWGKSDIIGRNVEVLLPKSASEQKPDQDDGSRNIFCRYLGQGRCEIMARRSTGDVFPADLTVTFAGSDPDGLIIVYLRDISDRKVNERALIDAKERAERTDRAKSRFLTVMSHEMRTPLNGVLGVLDLLRTTSLSDKQRRYVDVAAASSEVLMRHLHEALDITRIETGALTLAPQPFHFGEEVTRIVTVLEPLAKEKSIELTHHIDDGMQRYFVADGSRIAQIITNLIGNAIKFTGSGRVEVTASGIHTQLVTSATVCVRDTGIGVPEGLTEAIFEDFVALSHSSGRMSRGDGLGLSISRKLARLMGGDVTVSSVEGCGSEFKLTLPLKRAGGAEGTEQKKKAVGSAPQHDVPINILVVEDNNINRTVLQEMLQGMGHVVSTAAGGYEGYKLLQSQPFDLIFMDINMPDMDGIELTKRVRENDGPNRDTRIQGLTAYGREEFLHIAEAAGMDGFSTKPIRIQGIANILRDAKVSAPSATGPTEDIDPIIINELRNALGIGRLKESADAFFRETDDVLGGMRDMTLPDDHDDIAARLHNLGGAAALFGLRVLADAALETRAEVENATSRSLEAMLYELDICARAARNSFLELTK